jgi:hypothetical protein
MRSKLHLLTFEPPMSSNLKDIEFLNYFSHYLIALFRGFWGTQYCIVRSIKFVIKVDAGTVKACLVLNYRDIRHI